MLLQGCDATFPNPGKYVTKNKIACRSDLDQSGLAGTCPGDGTVTFKANGSPAAAPPADSSDIPNPGENALNAAPQSASQGNPSDSTILAGKSAAPQPPAGVQSAVPRPPSGGQEQHPSASEGAAAQATTVPDSLPFAGSPQNGSEEVNFVAKNKAEAEAEYAAGLQVQQPGGDGQHVAIPETNQAASQASAAPPPEQTGTTQNTKAAGQPSISPAAELSSDAKAQGTCSGTLKCSDDGQSFFLCGSTGWISMGRSSVSGLITPCQASILMNSILRQAPLPLGRFAKMAQSIMQMFKGGLRQLTSVMRPAFLVLRMVLHTPSVWQMVVATYHTSLSRLVTLVEEGYSK